MVVAAVAHGARAERRLGVGQLDLSRDGPGRRRPRATSAPAGRRRRCARRAGRRVLVGGRCRGPRGPARRGSAGRRGSRGSRRNRVDRLRSGGLTSKNGFSVVAPMSTSVPSSTAGSRASCWALLKRWISSRKRIVPWSRSPRRWRARSMTSRTSLTPAVTADSCSKALAVVPATARASVVLPVPGGPHSSTEDSRSCSTSRRSGRPGPSSCGCPTTSSIVRGRSRAASGAWLRRRSSAAAQNRSSRHARRRGRTACSSARPERHDLLDQPRRLDPLPALGTHGRPASARSPRRACGRGTSGAPGRGGCPPSTTSRATRRAPSRGARRPARRRRARGRSPRRARARRRRRAPRRLQAALGELPLPGDVGPLERQDRPSLAADGDHDPGAEVTAAHGAARYRSDRLHVARRVQWTGRRRRRVRP